MRKKDEQMALYTFLGILIGIIAILLLANTFFKGDTTYNYGGSIPAEPEVEYDSYDATLTLNPTNICVGDETRATITSNIANGVCAIFYDVGGGWQYLTNVNLNANGYFSQLQQINQVGSATFRAVCCDQVGNCKISNIVLLVVSPCSTTTTTQAEDYDCFDGDGGINFAVWSFCEDDYHQAGFPDVCENGYKKEWYCDDNGICQYIYGESCGGMACASIPYPTSQTTCDGGYCDSGACIFQPATLISPARCACGLIM